MKDWREKQTSFDDYANHYTLSRARVGQEWWDGRGAATRKPREGHVGGGRDR